MFSDGYLRILRLKSTILAQFPLAIAIQVLSANIFGTNLQEFTPTEHFVYHYFIKGWSCSLKTDNVFDVKETLINGYDPNTP